MPKTLPIIVVQHQEQYPAHWRRFAATLCFIEFYVEFVLRGNRLWYELSGKSGQPSQPDIWIALALIVRSILFFGLGRALWLNRSRANIWLWALISISALAIGARCYFISTKQITWFGSFVPTPTSLQTMFELNAPEVAWFSLFVAIGWYLRRTPRGTSIAPALWVVIAATWCLAQLILIPTEMGVSGEYRYALLAIAGSFMFLAPMSYGLLICLAAAGLLMGWKKTRYLFFAIAAAAAVPRLLWTFTLVSLVDAAIECLMMSSPFHPINPFPWPRLFLNNSTFLDVGVSLVGGVGPWLLIAWYIRRVPMKSVPDDGSPYPRHYCGKCQYNLQGLLGDRCPECGAELGDWEPRAKTTCNDQREKVESIPS